MYGQPLDPTKTTFDVQVDDDGSIMVFLQDQEDPDNDDVRDVDHPDFDKLFGNECENIFSPWTQEQIDDYHPNSGLKALKTKRQVVDYLLSLGMDLGDISDEVGG